MVKNYLPNISIIVPGSTILINLGNFNLSKDDKKQSQNNI
jgi:hypothetical protein